jgi:hypothetical protein
MPPPESGHIDVADADHGGARNVEFDGEIVVSSRIIDELSSGLYESPAACLKELINNAYDADATEVVMSVRPDADIIIINDNGTGMTRETFVNHFRRIAESRKRAITDVTPSGRPMIGKIGIGFVAANEICDRMDIVSTIAGSSELMKVSINFADMRIDPAERRRDRDGGEGEGESEGIAKGDYHGTTSTNAEVNEHYTRVYLRDIRGPAQDVLSGAEEGKRHNSLYGLKPSSIRDRLADVKLQSWDEFDSYSRAMLEIALNVPVRYHENWIPDEYADQIRPFAQHAEALNFDVILDGSSLRKPIVLNNGADGKSILRVFDLAGEHVGAKGYFYAASNKINPRELNGILIRIRNAAVGKYDSNYLGYPSWINGILSQWASCEVYADDRLEQSMNIDRKTLRTTDLPYVELRSMLHEKIKGYFSEVRAELYLKRSRTRNEERAKEQAHQLDQIKDELSRSLGESSANDVVNRLRKPPPRQRPSNQRKTGQAPPTGSSKAKPDSGQPEINLKALTAKFTAVQVLDMVTQAAKAAGLPPDLTSKLLSEVARLLSV